MVFVKKAYPEVAEENMKELVQQAKDFAMANGVVMRTHEKTADADVAMHAPFVLLPTVVAESCYIAAKRVQKHFDLLVDKLSRDHEFLQGALASTILVDDFTRRIWNIYNTVRQEGISQPCTLAINRCDYMFDCNPDGCETCITQTNIKLIEINTIACSFGGLSQQVTKLHKYIIQESSQEEKLSQLPENKAGDGLAEAMVKAWQCYDNPQSVILFLVSIPEQNIFDQRHVEFAIKRASNHKARVIRRSVEDLTERASLTEDRRLLIDGFEVSIVYKRAGYIPDHLTEKDWDTQLMIERSKAIKCPSASYQLVGTKKVQQVLAKPGVLEKYITDPSVIEEIRKTFVGQFSLDLNSEGDQNAAMAIANPNKFVLKPQREGGGHNFFGEDVKTKLLQLNGTKERSAYILMERVWPVSVHNYPVKVGHPVERSEMVSEIGIFGTLVRSENEIVFTNQEGHILRTKTLGTNEGGVATGYSCLDSPLLVTGETS